MSQNSQNITDIHSYTVFANIDDRNGKVEGYQMILTKEQMSLIEDIILSENIRVLEDSSYEVE